MRLNLERSGPWIGVGGMFIMAWLAFTTFVYAPWWGVAIHMIVLIPIAVWVSRWARTRPKETAFIPLAGLALLGVVTAIGVAWLDWGYS